ncbi:hypothetical protein DFH94DRAFT_694603 [Russula ochroleuca]|jgi:hypothetical protein|uniref:Uncharacterized protein n=1 Tax=Russula ochroleuca TaxID=152965 RepID=A0A9P5T659_9AGAM|nr:hypothetical protein DFH94DRAFT_694603 [Russula ochroleuca]
MRALTAYFFMGHAHFGGGHKGAACPAGKLDLMGSWGTLTDYLIGSSPSRACHPLTPSVVSLPPSPSLKLSRLFCARRRRKSAARPLPIRDGFGRPPARPPHASTSPLSVALPDLPQSPPSSPQHCPSALCASSLQERRAPPSYQGSRLGVPLLGRAYRTVLCAHDTWGGRMAASPLFKVRFLLFTGSIRCSALTVPSPLPVWTTTTTTTPPPLVPCATPLCRPPSLAFRCWRPIPSLQMRDGRGLHPLPSLVFRRRRSLPSPRSVPLPSSATLPSPISTTRPPSHPPPSRLDDDAPSPRPKRETEGGSTPPPPSPSSLSRRAAPLLAFGARWRGALHLHLPYHLPRARFRAPPPSSRLGRDGGGLYTSTSLTSFPALAFVHHPLPRVWGEMEGGSTPPPPLPPSPRSLSRTTPFLTLGARWRGAHLPHLPPPVLTFAHHPLPCVWGEMEGGSTSPPSPPPSPHSLLCATPFLAFGVRWRAPPPPPPPPPHISMSPVPPSPLPHSSNTL